MTNIKVGLLGILNASINQKIEEMNQTITDTRESLASDTKSSAGDKFETGPEMIQLEINKNQAQLEKVLLLKKSLSKIDEKTTMDKVGFGSVVVTNQGNYFISAAIGKIEFEKINYYALSIGSPIGQALLGKQVDDEVSFQNRIYKIEAIS